MHIGDIRVTIKTAKKNSPLARDEFAGELFFMGQNEVRKAWSLT